MNTMPVHIASDCIARALRFDTIIRRTPRQSKNDTNMYYHDIEIPSELRGFSDEQFWNAVSYYFRDNDAVRKQWEDERKRRQENGETPFVIAFCTVRKRPTKRRPGKMTLEAVGPIEVIHLP